MVLLTLTYKALIGFKEALFFKKYSLLLLSFFTSTIQLLSYEGFKEFLQTKLNREEVILMVILTALYGVAIALICLIDIGTGLLRSHIHRVKFSGEKFIVGFLRVIIYEALILFLFLFQIAAFISGWGAVVAVLMWLMFMFGVLIVLWEFRSIGKNMEEMFGKPMRMFYVLDSLIEVIEKKVVDRLRSSKMCTDEKS